MMLSCLGYSPPDLCRLIQAVLGRPGTPICSAALAGSTGLPSLCAKVGSECAALSMGKRPGYVFLVDC